MSAVRTLLLALLVAAPAASQNSQIALDGSLPHGRTDVLTGPGSGPDYTIGEDLGWRAGPNLFHSFDQFSIAANESATFTADGSLPALSHVIARVTGGEASAIDGALRSEIAGADFFLLNPSGVLFGGAASIDVPGSFTVSTAHRLDFAGTAASLDLLDASSPALRVEPPSAFGFVAGGPRSEIVFSNPAGGFETREYAVGQGETLTAVGGDVSVQNRVRLRATQGRVQIAAVGDAIGEIPFDLVGVDPSGLSGTVTITGRSELIATTSDRSANQGTVVIRGGRLVIDEASVVRAGDFAGPDGASIDLAVSESVSISGAGTLLRAESPGSRPSGGIRIAGPLVEVSDGALVRTLVDSTETGGDLVIQADDVRVTDGGILSTTTRRSGTGGHVRIEAANSISVIGGQIQSLASSEGPGGDLILQTDALVADAGRIGTESGSSGAAGSIAIEARSVDLIGAESRISTSNRSAVGVLGPSGDIAIVAQGAGGGDITLRDGARISAETLSAADGGLIEIQTDRLRVLGAAPDSGGMPVASAIQTGTLGSGRAGTLSIDAHLVELASTPTSDVAGLITAFVASGATGEGGVRDAGGQLRAIDIATHHLRISEGGQISTTTFGDGPAGAIDVQATGEVDLNGDTTIAGVRTPSGVFSRAETDQDGGNVTIRAASIEVRDGAEISTRALGAGRSGNVTLETSGLLRVVGGGLDRSVVTARAVGGPGGDVALNAASLEVLEGGVVDVSTSGAGTGGELRIEARTVLVAGRDERGLPASLGAQADGVGDAAGIRIEASRVEVGAGGQITALSRGIGGAAGDIAVDASEIIIAGEVTSESFGGTGGSVTLASAGDLRLDGGRVTALSADEGNAGDIRLSARRFLANNASIDATANAFGGNIEIIASEIVNLVNSDITATSRGGENAAGLAGGNILIDPPAVILNRSTITANGFGNANGGNIFIVGNPLLVSGDSTITASSQFGTAGTIVVTSPNAEITGDLAALPSDFLDASALLAESCLARDEVTGTFSVRAVPTLPPPPDAPFSPDAGATGQQCEAP